MRRPLLLLATLVALVVAAPAQAFELVTVGGSPYGAPVHVTGPPGDATRLLVVEKAGTIRLVKNGVAQPTPYLDITTKVDSDGGEEGLLSMAFAPDGQSFYVFYTSESDVVVERHVVAAGGDAAAAAPVVETLRIRHDVGDNHNGGQLHFGPDGNLWISTGDGGGVSGDSDGDAQNPSILLGKILRIAPRAGGGYDIPAGNPYAGGGGAPEVWALGFRNPWRFSFDRATGDLLIGDVGEGTQEEISRAAAPGLGCGDNYGWPYYEGTFELKSGPQPATHHPPMIARNRADDDPDWKAITGGYVLRDPALAEQGSYVYGDFYVPNLWLASLEAGPGAVTDDTVNSLSSFGEDGVGRVYVASYNGNVRRIAPDGGGPSAGTTAPPAQFAVPGCGPQTPAGPGTPTGPGGPGTPDPGVLPATGGSATTAVPPPSLLAGTARRQRAVRRGRLFVRGGCDVDCRLELTGRLRIGPRRFTLSGSRAGLRAGRRLTLVAALGRRARRAARAALRREARVRATLVLSATRLDGTPGTRRRTFRVTVTR